MTLCKAIFISDINKAKEVLNNVLVFLKKEIPYLTEEDMFDLRIIYSELVFNAIIHGNKQDLLKKVDFTVQLNGYDIVSTVKDEGNGFNHSKFFNQNRHLDDIINEHGRGLRLVESLSDFVCFNDIGNEVKVKKKMNYYST